MIIKITCNTPKGQAEKSIQMHKRYIIGSKKDILKEEKVVSDTQFYWILDFDDIKYYHKLLKRCANAEVMVKKVFRSIINVVKKTEKAKDKAKKGVQYIKKKILKRLIKQGISQDTAEGFVNDLDLENKHGIKEMIEFLQGDIIILEIID